MKIDVGKALDELLDRRETVTITGLGSLRLQNTSARISAGGQLLSPPSAQLTFFDVQTQNKPLRKYLEAKYDLSKKEAEKAIKNFSETILNTLVNYGEVDIDGIAQVKRKKGKVVITPLDSFTSKYYQGLPKVSLDGIAKKVASKPVKVLPPATIVEAKAVIKEKSADPIKTKEQIVREPATEIINETRPEPIGEPVTESIKDSITESLSEPLSETKTEQLPNLGTESVKESVSDPEKVITTKSTGPETMVTESTVSKAEDKKSIADIPVPEKVTTKKEVLPPPPVIPTTPEKVAIETEETPNLEPLSIKRISKSKSGKKRSSSKLAKETPVSKPVAPKPIAPKEATPKPVEKREEKRIEKLLEKPNKVTKPTTKPVTGLASKLAEPRESSHKVIKKEATPEPITPKSAVKKAEKLVEKKAEPIVTPAKKIEEAIKPKTVIADPPKVQAPKETSLPITPKPSTAQEKPVLTLNEKLAFKNLSQSSKSSAKTKIKSAEKSTSKSMTSATIKKKASSTSINESFANKTSGVKGSSYTPVPPKKEGKGFLRPLLGLLGLLLLALLLWKGCQAFSAKVTKKGSSAVVDTTENISSQTNSVYSDSDQLDASDAEDTISSSGSMSNTDSRSGNDSNIEESGDSEIHNKKPKQNTTKHTRTKQITADQASSGTIALENGQNCIIVVGSFSDYRNIKRLEAKLASQGYDVYREEYGPYTRVGFSFDCSDTNLEEYLYDIRKKLEAYAWYLQPDLYVEYR